MSGSSSLGTVLKAMILAGLLTGTALAAFHGVLTEPVIDQAIALEEAQAEHDQEALPPVSREAQKGGLLIGWVLYGLFVGIIFGGVYYLTQDRLPGRRPMIRALLLAGAACWLVALLPFLKYPANPPGVGLPETIEIRQALYLSFLLLSIAGGLMTAILSRHTRPRWVAGLGYAAFALALYGLMPANPDPISMPMELVASFRVLSAAGLLLFWLVLGVSFGILAEWLQRDEHSRGLQPAGT